MYTKDELSSRGMFSGLHERERRRVFSWQALRREHDGVQGSSIVAKTQGLWGRRRAKDVQLQKKRYGEGRPS